MSEVPKPRRTAKPRWYGDGLQFSCRPNCGACCKGPLPGFVYLDAAEIERLADHLELGLDDFGRRYLRQVDGRLALTEDRRTMDCSFWSDDAGCTVYRVRPAQCRQFPFWPEVTRSRSAWEDEAEACPGMNKGRLYSQEEIERIQAGKRGTRSGRKPRKTLRTI